ncbi:MAG: amino acid racemase [Chloroflexota bacterium]
MNTAATLTKTIGIVGGVGPFAGLDLQRKILEETVAQQDQDHLAVIAISQPAPIPDRTQFLLGETAVNPAYPITQQLLTLERAGATVAAIPCNTAHATPIFSVIQAELAKRYSTLTLLHMMQEVAHFMQTQLPQVQRVGVLSTTGTYRARIYPAALEPAGFTVLVPDEVQQTTVIHPAIYDPLYGIKACGTATARARADLLTGFATLRQQGAQAIILGCTEIPLALAEPEIDGIPLIDATRVLARALVREVDAARLRVL